MSIPTRRPLAFLTAFLLALVTVLIAGAPTQRAAAAGPVTNLDHLNFLLDTVTPEPADGHTTYRLDAEPTLVMPWTYADAVAGGGFRRVGGGSFDPATGRYSQGAYNTDDITRAAVVYLRHWRQTGSSVSRQKAYQLLRSVAYMQTVRGANRGRSVLWIQADGTLNPSAEPVELPDPSDSGPSFWQARTLWALGEGYAAFRASDPAFARFLRQRLRLSVRALNRDVLDAYGQYVRADGARVPAWLIGNGADATSEAVLGLAAYSTVRPGDELVRTALRRFAHGIAAMSAGTRRDWPYRAVLPWTESQSLWHAWGSQLSAALARSSAALGDRRLLQPAIAEATSFDPTLLTAGGADNGWLPVPIERVQIAYGVDSRVQSLLAVADVGRRPAAAELATFQAAWFFGANRSGQPIYDPDTGITFDGLEADGRINRNSGAESTIHGLLAMLALDAHPVVRDHARGLTSVEQRDGLRVLEAESAVVTDGTVVTPASAWTGESSYSGGSYLELRTGQRARFDLGSSSASAWIQPVSWNPEGGSLRSQWSQDGDGLGTLRHRVGPQGVTAVPGALLPLTLPETVQPVAGPVQVRAIGGTLRLDAVLVRPLLGSITLTGSAGRRTMLHSTSAGLQRVQIGTAGTTTRWRVYDASGRLVSQRSTSGTARITLPAWGMAVLSS